MKDKSWRFSQRAAVTAVALVLSAAAQAATVRGSLDPLGANGIPPYNGFAIFDVPCILSSVPAGWHSTAGCGIVMESATVYLYSGIDGDPPNLPQGSNSPALLQDTLIFGPPGPNYIFGFLVDGAGNLLGLDSNLSSGVSSSPFSRDFFLSFQSGCLDDGNLIPGDPVCDPFFDFEFDSAPTFALTSVQTESNPVGILTDSNGFSSPTDRGGLTFTAVPEPGTMSLILGALGGGWLARRRRSKLAA